MNAVFVRHKLYPKPYSLDTTNMPLNIDPAIANFIRPRRQSWLVQLPTSLDTGDLPIKIDSANVNVVCHKRYTDNNDPAIANLARITINISLGTDNFFKHCQYNNKIFILQLPTSLDRR